MKKILIVLLIIVIAAIKYLPNEEERAYMILSNHLKQHFKEEFQIDYLAKRRVDNDIWFEAEVYPKRYICTVREYDSYYRGKGFVTLKNGPGDTYGKVILNEGANEYYRPKLEELFGKNILPVLTVKGSYIDRVPSFEKEKENGKLTSLEGGIYIFGRVENELDREKYRESIYKFIQYLKETNSFDYSNLYIAIVDERVLSLEYQSNREYQKELEKKYLEGSKRNIRKKIIDKIGEKYTIHNEILSSINRGIFSGMSGLNRYPEIKGGILLSESMYSPKFIENHTLFKNEKIKEYNSKAEIFE